MKTILTIITHTLETWALHIFYVMTSHYSATGSHHHSTGQWPLSTRQPSLFYQTFLQIKTHYYTHQKRLPPPKYESACVSSDDTSDQMLYYRHHSKMVNNQYVSTYASSKGTVQEMPYNTHHSKMATVPCVYAYALSVYSADQKPYYTHHM